MELGQRPGKQRNKLFDTFILHQRTSAYCWSEELVLSTSGLWAACGSPLRFVRPAYVLRNIVSTVL